jgi:transcriptional regulator with XRE-family HTH domain
MKPWAILIKSELERRDWSERDLAHEASLHPSVINRLLKTDSDPQISTLAKIAQALGVSLSKLIMEEDSGERNLNVSSAIPSAELLGSAVLAVLKFPAETVRELGQVSEKMYPILVYMIHLLAKKSPEVEERVVLEKLHRLLRKSG